VLGQLAIFGDWSNGRGQELSTEAIEADTVFEGEIAFNCPGLRDAAVSAAMQLVPDIVGMPRSVAEL